MKEKAILVEIDEQGNCSLDLQGFRGNGCADVAKDFQGNDAVRSVRNKPELYAPAPASKQQQQQS
jgi:hypothetical protein